jgi:hypothetical protein
MRAGKARGGVAAGEAIVMTELVLKQNAGGLAVTNPLHFPHSQFYIFNQSE